jgi:RND family efflux transporter MFP subunit
MAKVNRGWFTRKRVILIAVAALLLLGYSYYKEKAALFAEPVVTVDHVKKETVPVFLEYVGQTAAVKSADIRARVEGFLIERDFVEGDDVKEGDLMFVIDPAPYEAALAEAKGNLAKAESAAAYAREQVGRYKSLVEKDYITKENYDSLMTQAQEAESTVESARAAVVNAELNLGYCRMYAPFDGRMGRDLVHVGNLVGAAGQATELATIVQLDPIWVYFSPSDEELPRIIEKMRGGALAVDLTFTDGSAYPHGGKLDFVDNAVDTGTSTVAMRATVPNPEKSLLPGLYVNARLHLEEMPDALLVPEKAIASDQGGQYVMIVKSDETLAKSYVKTGDPYEDWRVISDGVSDGDVVVVEGMQSVRPGMEVRTKDASAPKEKTGTLKGLVMKALFM